MQTGLPGNLLHQLLGPHDGDWAELKKGYGVLRGADHRQHILRFVHLVEYVGHDKGNLQPEARAGMRVPLTLKPLGCPAHPARFAFLLLSRPRALRVSTGF